MTEQKDIRNIKELLALVFAIAIPIVKAAKKDGFQWTDVFAFLGSEDFKSAIGPALEGMSELPAEFKDFSWQEGIELSGYTLEEIKKLIEAIVKPS